jgi:nucleoside-diphosphate-sugar epimerase
MTHTVFVTGGSGFIGRNLVRRLLREGHAVVALARSGASAAKLAALGARVARGDIRDLASLETGMAGCDWLVHCAADTGHNAFEAGQHETNLQGARNVFTAARSAGIKRAVHLSTEAVLLSGAPLVSADETTPYPKRFAGSYSASKAAAEKAALALNSAACAVMVIRPRFVWGRDDSTALPQLIAATRDGRLTWISGGNYPTSTTHVDNAVEGIMLALERGRGGEVYFITDGEPVGFRDFISTLLRRTGHHPPKTSQPRWLVVPVVWAGDWMERVTRGRVKAMIGRQEYGTIGVEVTLNIDKARRELGYAPVISREEGLATLGKA